MRITIPEFENKSDLFAYLKENKTKLIDQKKSMPVVSEAVSFGASTIKTKTDVVTKANEPVTEDVDVLRVKVVANTANWMDSHSDVILPDAWKKSISERKSIIPHIHDHKWEVGAKVGEVVDILAQDLSFAELGITGNGSTQSLVFITDIMKSYNEKVFNQYKSGSINQHSIGMQYIKLELAINDENSEKEFDFWNKHIDSVINKDSAEAQGFFWVVQELKLIENSAVLFGSNEITPTLDNDLKNIQPSTDTEKDESEKSAQDLESEKSNKQKQLKQFYLNQIVS